MKKNDYLKLKIGMFIGIFLISLSSTSFAGGCATHQSCPVGKLCECTITPSSAYERFFYFDFLGIQKNKTYECTLTSWPTTLTIVLNGSTFPEGATYKCTGSCPRFPIELSIDTKTMLQKEDTLIIKYFVPAGDYPTKVTANCHMNDLDFPIHAPFPW